MKIKKIILLLFIYLSLSFSPVYAVINVGIVFFYPPFIMSPSEGFDVDLAGQLFKRLNLQYKLIPMNFSDLFPALDSGRIDIALGGICISPAREKKYIFSLPYMLSKAQFMTLKSNNIKSVLDLQGKNVGVIQGETEGGVFNDYLSEHFANNFTIVKFTDMEDIISALNSGNIAAVFILRSSANYWQQNGGGAFVEIGAPIAIGEGIAIMALPKNAALIEQINQQLQAMEKDSIYINLYNTYFANE